MTSGWCRVGASDEVDDRQPRRFRLEAADVLIARVEGVLHAVDNICTHAFACLHEGRRRGVRIICPLHGASFDLRTGAVLGQPATEPLKCYAVREVDGSIEILLPPGA
jgi:nitrite reductase/ring-hydroxylating ferredoxin subunit